MIPKFRVAFKNKIFGEVVSIDFIDETVTIAVYDKVDGIYIGDSVLGLNQVTLMQSTGLFDKNDKEIFEGDIVRFHTPQLATIGVVEFDKNEACFKVRNDFGGHYVTMFHTRYFEVIGDIYQNPELAEAEND